MYIKDSRKPHFFSTYSDITNDFWALTIATQCAGEFHLHYWMWLSQQPYWKLHNEKAGVGFQLQTSNSNLAVFHNFCPMEPCKHKLKVSFSLHSHQNHSFVPSLKLSLLPNIVLLSSQTFYNSFLTMQNVGLCDDPNKFPIPISNCK